MLSIRLPPLGGLSCAIQPLATIYSEEKLALIRCIKWVITMSKLFKNKLSKKQTQWLWFIALWLGGFTTVYIIAYIIKLAMRIA